jgi:transcriptional regulator GlxA family with amidase domain
MDLLALALIAEPDRQPTAERSVQAARLSSIKAYIEAHLGDPNLSPAAIARNNGISLRYLHYLFQAVEMTVSDWLRLRRLERCRDMLTSPQHARKSITEIAFSTGFSSSSHFSNLFRAQYSIRPSDVRGPSTYPSYDDVRLRRSERRQD